MSKNKWIVLGVLLLIAYTYYLVNSGLEGQKASYEAGYEQGLEDGYSQCMSDYGIEE